MNPAARITATQPHAVDYDLPPTTLAELLDAAAAVAGDRAAVTDGGHTLTYAELSSSARRLAGAFVDLGVVPGDRVLIQLPNRVETMIAAWATFVCGAVLVPVVPIYRSHEVAFIVGQVQPKVLIAPAEYRGHRHADALRAVAPAGSTVLEVDGRTGTGSLEALLGSPEPAPRPVPDGVAAQDIAVVLYTSGTTAQPKGALHSHQTLIAEAVDVAQWCRLTGEDTVFMASPLSHITGLCYGIVLPVLLACPLVLQDRWSPDEAVRIIEQHGCTFTVSATPFLRGLVDAYTGTVGSSLRVFVCGGADIPADLVRAGHRVMGTRVVRTYGSTELPTSSMAEPFGDLDAGADTEGLPMGENEIRLVPLGDGVSELQVRGPELFLGYLDAALDIEAFTDDGWFRTGDQARVDEAGRLHITGRIKDIINRGGEKFSVAEVESLLLSHPGVADVAVVGYHDPVLVERACAFVVPSGTAPTVEQLRDHLLGLGVSVQKAPERIVVVDELPRTASGKVQRYVLREQVRSGR